MHRTLLDLTTNIDRAAGKLVGEYRPDDLYAFRVNSRRIRSILKHIDSHRSRSFRKTWGGFAAVTNEARDWDVFLITAADLLSDEDLSGFEKLNHKRIQFCHEAVIDMLKSAHWHRHLEEWVHYLEWAEEEIPLAGEQSFALDRTLSGAHAALERAKAVNDDHTWHKFRIKVKEVRYVADAARSDPDTDKYLSGLIEGCKNLQSLLGDWHDTVVQLSMLEELDNTAVHENLANMILERKQLFLSQTLEAVDGLPLFSARPEPLK